MKRLLPLLLAVVLLTACHRNRLPKDVMPQERMVEFLADAYLLEGFYAIETQYRYDLFPEEVLQRYDSILAVHNLTREEVEHSFDYYSKHLDAYQAIQDSVISRIEGQGTADTDVPR